MEPLVEDLVAEQLELKGHLEALSEAQWRAPTRCEGWDVTDVVIHLAQSDEMAVGSARGQFAEVLGGLAEGLGTAGAVDEGVALMVAGQRGVGSTELLERWSSTANSLVEALDGMNLSTRVMWVTGDPMKMPSAFVSSQSAMMERFSYPKVR